MENKTVATALQVLEKQLNRPLATALEVCARCGICTEACHYYVADPSLEHVPAYRAEQLRKVYRREHDFFGKHFPNWVNAKDLDEATLEKIATLGNGKYFRATNSQDELDAIYKEVNALQKSEFGTKQFTDFEDQFQYFIGGALVLLLIEVFLSDKKIPWLEKINPLRGITVDNKQ